MVGQFLTLVRNGDEVTATGTFDPQNPNVKHATILFMVVQGENDSMVWTRGYGVWERSDAANGQADPNSVVPWVGTANAEGDGVNGSRGWLEPGQDNGTVRGIAVALVVLPAQPGQGDRADKFEPPTIQGLTWCVSTKLTWAPSTQAPA